MESLILNVCNAVDADTFLLAVVMFASYFMLNYRIGQQERLVREALSNGVRRDIRKLDEKIDGFAQNLAQLRGEHNARHGGQ